MNKNLDFDKICKDYCGTKQAKHCIEHGFPTCKIAIDDYKERTKYDKTQR